MWIDVGTSKRSSLLSDMLMLAPDRVDGLIGIGLEISPERLEAHRSFVSAAMSTHPEVAARWTELEFAASSACLGEKVVGEQFSLAGGSIIDWPCLLNPPHPECSRNAKRIQYTSQSTSVSTCTLDSIISAARDVFGPISVEYIKIDAEGHDVDVVRGILRHAREVDHLLLELQDLLPNSREHDEIGLAGTKSGTLADANSLMNSLNFSLSYCEENNLYLKQINCAYHRVGVAEVCITGRPQKSGTPETQLHAGPPCNHLKRKIWPVRSLELLLTQTLAS